jgi:hypothetical protein
MKNPNCPEPTPIKCKCGRKLWIWADQFTNTCERCGRDYDGQGDLLAPRSQWGEETGETYTEIMMGDY